MNIGDYVRTNKGLIAKIIDFCECEQCKERRFYEPILDTTNFYITNLDKENNFEGLKFSHSIISLIEVGDYVNEFKVIDILENDIYVSDYYAESCIGVVKVKDIKSIVTKEQFEEMEYKL